MPEGLIVVEHPVLEDRLAVLRDAATPHGAFRQALSEASAILAIEATRDLPTVERAIDTPLERVRLARAVIAHSQANTIEEKLANAALLDLGSDSRWLLRAGLLQAVAVRVGAARTPAGVLLAA